MVLIRVTTPQWLRGAGRAGAVIVGLAVLVWVFGVLVPQWAVGPDDGMPRQEWLAAVNNVRTALLSGLSVAGGLAVAAIGVRRFYLDRANQRLDADKHLIAQFDGASARLGSDDPVVRAGATRTLFRLMVDSPRDHALVVRTLCDFVRSRAPRTAEAPPSHLELDVLAAVDGLRERPPPPVPCRPDLSGTHLSGADFTGAQLGGVLFRNAQLDHVDLTGAHLDGAEFTGTTDLTGAAMAGVTAVGADFANATMNEADLAGADLRSAVLRRTRLSAATLTDVDLTGADLTDTVLHGADLTGARGLTTAMVRAALTDNDTRLPSALAADGR